MRVKITMACTECKQRNYDTVKNKKEHAGQLEASAYCRSCKKAYGPSRNEVGRELSMAKDEATKPQEEEKKSIRLPQRSQKRYQEASHGLFLSLLQRIRAWSSS